MAASVTIAGTIGDVKIGIGPKGSPVHEVVEAAANEQAVLGLDFNSLVPVINGRDATFDSTVYDGDVVTVAPAVENGSRLT